MIRVPSLRRRVVPPVRARWGRGLLALALLSPLAPSAQAPSAMPDDQTLRNQYPGTPVPGLTPAQLRAFEHGQVLFSKLWKPADGLGPRFNADACMTCHHNPLPGGNEFAPDRFVVHAPSCTDRVGGHGCPRFALGPDGAVQALPRPPDAVMRKPQSLFGLGMLEAVSDADIEALARLQRDDPDGVRGRPGRTADGRVGRFGWKARFAGIDDFVAAAFHAEIGLDTRAYATSAKPEIGRAVVAGTSQFLRLLAAPPLTPRGDVERGRALMDDLRCTACHVPALRTGRSAVPLLTGRRVVAHTDLLLHDMGPALAEPVDEGGVGPARFRTPPLWGLNASGPPYLHDGRAATITDAILMHGGEAARSVERFKALAPLDVDHLLRYLNSL
ncbi:di-heme oxidoredictase family protein [Aquabacterium humicola]|uniref:di-heme oxidoredictase family protein n=1 Tax=Aquabacterium humicola TaxID=3237377 RepID=UPI002542CEDE|nr:di-heme oxidoredictase family protein [Rubrivivax pictus]